jgi:hypothetical protein
VKRRFVVAVDSPTPEQTKAINGIFRDKYGWWHWIPGVWLVTDSTNTINTTWIRDQIGGVAPGVRNLVIEVTHKTWSGFGPAGANRNMFDWIRNTWQS